MRTALFSTVLSVLCSTLGCGGRVEESRRSFGDDSPGGSAEDVESNSGTTHVDFESEGEYGGGPNYPGTNGGDSGPLGPSTPPPPQSEEGGPDPESPSEKDGATVEPGVSCDPEGQPASVPRQLYCGCTPSAEFECISAYTSTRFAPCPTEFAPGNSICQDELNAPIQGCWISDPQGSMMECKCLPEGVWACR